MTNLQNIFSVIFALSLSLVMACGPDPSCEGDDCVDDTGVEDGTGSLYVSPSFVGEDIDDCTVTGQRVDATASTSSFTFGCNESFDLSAGDYRLQIGSGNYGGVPGCELPDGNIVVAPDVSASVVKGEENEVSPTMNQYVDGRFDCLLETWYVEDNPDVDDPVTTSDEGPWDLRVEGGNTLVNEDMWHWNIFSDFDRFEVTGQELILHDSDTLYPAHLQASRISKDEIFFQVKLEGWRIHRMTCTPH